jgi:GR25 family glycosyltransferase involved in LPS biosynthesis
MVGGPPADEAARLVRPGGPTVSYRCGSGRIVLPRAWLTIEDDVAVKVLNLDRRPDRWARTVEALAGAGLGRYTRVAARDGRELRADVDDLRVFRGNHFGSRRGVIGCALSHLGLWRALAACPDPGATWLILEDDIAFGPDFLGEWSRRHDEVSQLEPRWDLLFLGLHVDRPEPDVDRAPAARPVERVRRVERLAGVPPGVLGGSFAYEIRRAGAWRLLEWVAQEGVRMPIDAFILYHVTGLRAFVVEPNLVWSEHVRQSPTVDSDVQWDVVSVEGVPTSAPASGRHDARH